MTTEQSEELSGRILETLRSAISEIKTGEAALGFSGGLDSTLLFYLSKMSLIPYTVGFSNSKDILNSRKASNLLNTHSNELLLEGVNLKDYVSILRDIDPLIRKDEIGYELVLTILVDRTEEKEIVTGQGADELFYGYRRFVDEPDLTNEDHIRKLMDVTLPREMKIAEYFDKKIVTPYLNDELVNIMRDVPKSMNIAGGVSKVMLREVARIAGLPEDLVMIGKKAAQYGSGISSRLKGML